MKHWIISLIIMEWIFLHFSRDPKHLQCICYSFPPRSYGDGELLVLHQLPCADWQKSGYQYVHPALRIIIRTFIYIHTCVISVSCPRTQQQWTEGGGDRTMTLPSLTNLLWVTVAPSIKLSLMDVTFCQISEQIVMFFCSTCFFSSLTCCKCCIGPPWQLFLYNHYCVNISFSLMRPWKREQPSTGCNNQQNYTLEDVLWMNIQSHIKALGTLKKAGRDGSMSQRKHKFRITSVSF